MSQSSRLKVYYDGDCPLCSREIDHYARLDAGGAIDFVDIAADPEAGAADGVTCEAAMRRIRAVDADGRSFTSAEVFAEIWRRLPSRFWRWSARLLKLPPVLWLANALYAPFADNRMAISRVAARAFGLR